MSVVLNIRLDINSISALHQTNLGKCISLQQIYIGGREGWWEADAGNYPERMTSREKKEALKRDGERQREREMKRMKRASNSIPKPIEF